MAEKEYDLWLERFSRDCITKSCIILSGNVDDIILDKNSSGRYVPVIDALTALLKNRYRNIVRWDRVDGIDRKNMSCAASAPKTSSTYDIGEDIPDDEDLPKYAQPEEFLPYMLGMIREGVGGNAFILDYSEHLFGNAASLSEKEREYLAVLGKTLELSKSNNLLDVQINNDDIVILISKNLSSIPPIFYQRNPSVSLISIPLPGRNERERFVSANASALRVSPDIGQSGARFDDFIDSLDGFSLKEIAQVCKLSRSPDIERMSCEKLLNLYKYGKKVSPWEDLSREKLNTVEETLKKRVKGQDEAVRKVKEVLIRAYTGFSGLQHSAKQKKPKGTLFFVGPTGVGKTELAKSLAEFVFGDENACIRFDMSEYNHEHSDQRLVGAPPGYVGYEAGGQLTNAVKERPFCVILFDEIEKAHGKILDKFLQILEDGRLTDGKGDTVSFAETIIIFTSNIGAATVSADTPPEMVHDAFIRQVRTHFVQTLGRPELLNRIGDNIVPFNFIDNQDVLAQIAKAKFANIIVYVREKYHAELEFEDENEAFLAIAGQAGKANGGRGVLNVLESRVVDPLSDFIFHSIELLSGRRIVIRFAIPENKNYPLFIFEIR